MHTNRALRAFFFIFKKAQTLPGACNSIKKEALAQVFSCEICEISKNTFSYRALLVAAFVFLNILHISL